MVKIKIRTTKGPGTSRYYVARVHRSIDLVNKLFRRTPVYRQRKDFLFGLQQKWQEDINSKKIALKITNHKKHLLKVRMVR